MPGAGNTSSDANPATEIRSGIRRVFKNSTTGRREQDAFRRPQAVRSFLTETIRPDSDASITTGRPAKVPESRPVIVSLGAYLYPGCEF
jgi:hypothetical protein